MKLFLWWVIFFYIVRTWPPFGFISNVIALLQEIIRSPFLSSFNEVCVWLCSLLLTFTIPNSILNIYLNFEL